jgi:hypothetical protein
MTRLFARMLVLGFSELVLACSGSQAPSNSESSGGTTLDTGGVFGGNGGVANTGGQSADGVGGTSGMGGGVTDVTISGGAANGGKTSAGGAGTGGTAPPTGGSKTATGGVAAGGGATSTGGKTSTGGAGTGGAAPTGGSKAATGGTAATGGAISTGACVTGLGTAFPPLTNYTARDGGYGPVDATRKTGDVSLGTGADGSANTVAIFRPAAAKYGQDGVRHPVIVWGNGHTNTVDIWQSFLARVATYGFVVVAPEQTEVTADHMNKALDYVIKLANDPAGVDCGKVDTTKLGSTGYSLGGMGAITVASDARITSTFFFASNGNVKNLKAPWGVIGGDADTTFSFAAISTAVTGSTQPAFGAALVGVDHNGVAMNGKAQEGYIGWMRWRFMGDQAGHDMFVGPNCQLCTDSTFSGVVKTSTFDSL